MKLLVSFLSALLCAVAIGCTAPTDVDSAAGDEPIPQSDKPKNSQAEAEAPAPSVTPIEWPAGVDADKLRGGVRGAIDYLVRTTDDDGKFAYIVNTDPDIPATDEYNVVRHAGTMYGLGMFLERYDDEDGRVKAALIRQGRFLIDQIKPVPGQKDMLAIWSDPAVTGIDEPRQAELGSAGLGLIGLTSLERVAPGSVSEQSLTNLARFILFMQHKDGSFSARYIPEGPGRVDVPQLLFYPGESALGLILLYEVDHNPQWLEAAARALRFMAHQRDAKDRPVLDHWMLLATARIWPHLDQVKEYVSREELIDYSVELSERLMEPSLSSLDDPRIKGCITGSGMTCPTATRVEGLMSALAYLPDEHGHLRAKIQRVSEDAIEFLLACQVAEGKYRGGIPYAMFRLPEDHPLQRYDYNRLSGEIRIDYVHHAISGMMLYDDVCLRK